MFIWTIMLGAMVGVRESTHFEVDLWPQLPRRGEALTRLIGRIGVLVIAFVFVFAGIEFTKFAWKRTSELADLPLWLIHVAWPVTGLSWIAFLGEQVLDDLRIISGRRS
jgi:TRAP-type C4-dicarboxylate transport system permease small subunit